MEPLPSEHSQSQEKTCEKHVLQDDWPVKSVMGLNLKKQNQLHGDTIFKSADKFIIILLKMIQLKNLSQNSIL